MWPGQQPPGGEQNPQDPNQNPNPYQQPGYGQQPNPAPNPYQQPGYGQQQPGYPQQQPGYPQPNPYQQPTVPMYGQGGQPGPPKPPGDDRRKTKITAIVAVLAVLVAAGVTGFLVLGKDDDKKPVADAKSSPSPTGSGSQEPSPTTSQANPRDGSAGAKPQVPGWKAVTNPEHGTVFDVPPEWEVQKAGIIAGFEDSKKGDGTPYISFSAPAYLKSKWCQSDPNHDGQMSDTSLAGTGTKGGQGAKDTQTAARNEAGAWVFGAYAQEDPKGKDKITVSKAKPYTTKSGLTGSYATASSKGLAKKTKCDTDGKSVAFTFSNAKGDFTTWVLYANTGVTGEVPDATVMKILNTVRLPESAS